VRVSDDALDLFWPIIAAAFAAAAIALIALLSCAPLPPPTGRRVWIVGEPAGVEMSVPHSACRHSVDCVLGASCQRPPGMLQGVCGRTVDAIGAAVDGRPAVCRSRGDCPPGFECLNLNRDREGACVLRMVQP
jgi:hypothetical protein